MNENVFLVDPSTLKYVETAVNKSDGAIQSYQTDNSVYRTVKVLFAVLKYECECNCDMDTYISFICDLLGMMAKHADKNEYTVELNTRDTMAGLPNMSVYGIQLLLMQISTNIALYEILHDEYMNYKYADSNEKEEDNEEFLLKKIDAE